jgi:hypothetical protein
MPQNPLSTLIESYKGGGVKAGMKESEGLGKELSAKRDMVAEGRKALTGSMATMPAPKPMPATVKPNPATQYGTKPGEKRMDVSEMTKPLGSFKKGGKVPKTGVYELHKGEEVRTPSQHEKMQKHVMGLAESVLGHEEGPEKPMPPKVDRQMHIKKLADNSFHIRHEHDHPEVHKDEEYSAKDLTELKKHMDDHFGKGEMKESAEEESKESPAVEQMEKALGYES